MTYVDGFVAAVPTANREKYQHHADIAAQVFKEHGALSVVECWGDDVPECSASRRRRWCFPGFSGPRRPCATRPTTR